MPETESNSRASRWLRLTGSLSAKLIVTLLAAMVVTFGVLGWVNIRLHRNHLQAASLASAERIGDVIKRSTSYYMMRNDREALYEIISTMGSEPGVVKIRIFNQEGRISYSSEPREVNEMVDKSAEQCYACHAPAEPLTKLNRPDRFRIMQPNGERVLGIITPIENSPACSNAACHAHPAEQKILGVLDTNVSLAAGDASLAESTRAMLIYTGAAVVVISLLSLMVILRVVHRPVRALTAGTVKLADGDLGYQIDVASDDELGRLAQSFNRMSLELRAANEEVVQWARTLEERVEQKSGQLKRAHDSMLRVEKMASLGKLAAVVAHEINNPLSGILTYSKLLKKWTASAPDEARAKEIRECLDLIESESRRCGELVKNLLTFSRTAPMNLEWRNLNTVFERCVKLVQHQLELNGVQVHQELAPDLPSLQCDPSQMEQVALALIMNAIDAMPRGGNLWLRSGVRPTGEIELVVRDDGAGIPDDVLPRLFEPFVTTKESGKGVGLGLAISQGIVERHGGRMEVESQPGHGSTFRIVLPQESGVAAAHHAAEAAAGKR